MDLNMGMTGGLLTLALIIRAACIPLQVYSQVNTIKSSLLHPDTMDMRTRMNDYARQGVGYLNDIRTVKLKWQKILKFID